MAYGQYLMDNIQPTDYFQCTAGAAIQKLVNEAETVGLEARRDFLELNPRPIPEPLGVSKILHVDDQRQGRRGQQGLPPRGSLTGNTDHPEDHEDRGEDEEEEQNLLLDPADRDDEEHTEENDFHGGAFGYEEDENE